VSAFLYRFDAARRNKGYGVMVRSNSLSHESMMFAVSCVANNMSIPCKTTFLPPLVGSDMV
jgi:hypothetical protein